MFNITEYIPIEKQMLLDAQKYIERADMYFKIGKYHHCAGCLAKAAKKIEQAERFGKSIDLIPGMKPMLDCMANHIANKLLKG